MGINSFGEKRVNKNISRLMVAIFKSCDVDLLLNYCLSKLEIEKRGITQAQIDEMINLITKQDK